MDRWTLELFLSNDRGESYRQCIELTRDDIESGMTERTMGDMEMAADLGVPVPGLTFDGVVTMMKKREFRRGLLRKAAVRLVERMADFMEDREGWHGTDRAEAANQQKGREG